MKIFTALSNENYDPQLVTFNAEALAMKQNSRNSIVRTFMAHVFLVTLFEHLQTFIRFNIKARDVTSPPRCYAKMSHP